MGDSSAPSGATTGSHEVAFAAGVSKPVGSHTDDASRRALDVLAFPDEVDPLARTCVASDSIEQGRTSPASYKQATAQSNSVEGADRLSLSSDPPGSIAQRQDALRPHDVAGSDSLARLIDNEKDDVEHAGRPTEEPMVPRSRQSSQIVHGGTADSRATSAPVQGCNTATLVAAALTPVDVPLELGADPAAPKHAGFATKPVALESASVMLKPADGPDIVAAKAIAPYLDHFKDRSSFAELPSRTRLDMLLAVNTKISNAVRQGATGEMVEQLCTLSLLLPLQFFRLHSNGILSHCHRVNSCYSDWYADGPAQGKVGSRPARRRRCGIPTDSESLGTAQNRASAAEP